MIKEPLPSSQALRKGVFASIAHSVDLFVSTRPRVDIFYISHVLLNWKKRCDLRGLNLVMLVALCFEVAYCPRGDRAYGF